MSLEAKIEALTAAVVEMTAVMKTQTVLVEMPASPAILAQQQLQNRVADEALQKSASSIKIEDLPNAKPEPTKSEPTSGISQTSSEESEPVTYDDVKRATNAVSKISRDKAIAGLARFGVSSATKLTEQQWPGYVKYMTQVANGEIDPEASHA